MAKSSMQKMKILLVMKELLEKTDEEHPMSMADLISSLEQNGILAERKSIYDDIEILREFGIDIVNRREQPSGYYVAGRTFELPELKLLVDSVQCAKFITRKKSEELIRKLESLTSRHNAIQLHRQVFVLNRVKTMNENIYYSVDKIHQAISQNAKVRFQYCEWNISKQMCLRKNGLPYEISPWALTWDDENYYMIGYDRVGGMIKHYRVDKIVNLEVLKTPREGKTLFAQFDLAGYSRKVFGMFGGQEEVVRLVCSNDLVGVVLDRFGKDVILNPEGEDSFSVAVRVNVSQQFFGWLFALGDGVKIDGPAEVAAQFQKQIAAVADKYK